MPEERKTESKKKREEAYGLLLKLQEAAENKRLGDAKKLSARIDVFVRKTYLKDKELACEIDNCRQSFYLSLTGMKDNYAALVKDGRKRLEEIGRKYHDKV